MGRRLLLINVVMLVGIYLLARHVTASWHDYQTEKSVNNVVKTVKPPDTEKTRVMSPAPPEAPLPDTMWTVIPEKDLFMPDRRPAPPPDQQVVEQPPKLVKNPSLNGILNNQGKKQALITIFEAANAQRGQSRTVSLGDNVQGYTVTDISDTTLTMKWKDTTEIVIDMFDATPQQERANQATQRVAVATVVTIGSSAPALDAGDTSEAPGGAEAPAMLQPGAARAGTAAGRMQPGNAPQRGEGAVAPPQRPGTVGMPGGGAVPFTSRTRRENR